MTKYARFDPSVNDPKPVIGWYDTDLNYPTLPDMSGMLTLSDPQWAAHFINPNAWAIESNALVPFAQPVPVPVVPVPPTKDELLAKLNALQAQIAALPN